MDYLAEEWRKAQRILDQIYPLMEQMGKHPRSWVRRLVETWNAAIKATATSVA
jgi:hypothetical protein